MLGGIVGGLLAGYLMQWIGRKLTSVLSALPYMVGLAVRCSLRVLRFLKARIHTIRAYLRAIITEVLKIGRLYITS